MPSLLSAVGGGEEIGTSPAGSVTARAGRPARRLLSFSCRRPSATVAHLDPSVAHLDAPGPTPTLLSSGVAGAGLDRAATRREVDGAQDPDAVAAAAGARAEDVAICGIKPHEGTFASRRATLGGGRAGRRWALRSPVRGCEVLEGSARG